MLRTAQIEDLSTIMHILHQTVQALNKIGNDQWDNAYPLESDILRDIERSEMYVYELNGLIGGFICLNNEEPTEYMPLPWSKSDQALVVHRLAVAEDFRGQGIAEKLLAFADKQAIAHNHYLKTDTYSPNLAAQKIFTKCGYILVGNMVFRGKSQLFHCYEKILPCY